MGRSSLCAGGLAIVLAAAILAGCGGGEDAPEEPVRRTSFFVDPGGPAAEQERRWRQEGREEDADAIGVIAREPVARWMTGDEPDVTASVAGVTHAAAAAGQTALLVAYNVPGRDCNLYSKGGAADPGAYGRWIRAFAAGIGDRPATVILEPDAVAQLVEGCVAPDAARARPELLRDAVEVLSAQPQVRVYLDAGNAGWIEHAALVEPLRQAGVARADGFALNVSNFYTTEESVAYGGALSDALDGAHFVVDTGRNGNGPLSGDTAEPWCNPPGRALGTPPTTATGDPRVDAFLWVKQPGDSDGECGRGEPPAGTWWPEYALGLVRAR